MKTRGCEFSFSILNLKLIFTSLARVRTIHILIPFSGFFLKIRMKTMRAILREKIETL